jgi:leucyl aminopeptidase
MPLHPLLADADASAIAIHLTDAAGLAALQATLPPASQRYLAATAYKATPGRIALLPGSDGAIVGVVMGIEAADATHRDPFLTGKLARELPAGTYAFATLPADPTLATLGFLLGGYRFMRYKRSETEPPRLVPPAGVDPARLARIADAVCMGRDLVNTPANDLGPSALAQAARAMAEARGASVTTIVGDELLDQNFPMIHAVGRASTDAPRLVDITWGDPAHPRVTLVGKGVCYDTGGLDIKPSSAMALMKKDMGGAATALAAARMIMDAGLKVRLRVLLPIVENAISGSAFRTGDVLKSRKGLTVEIGNTDAEGRLILADALARACEETPALLIDYATLTGAARVALGPDLPPFMTDDEALAADIQRLGMAVNDPVWRLPLWKPYDSGLDGRIADLGNVTSGGMAGAITAGLFLKRFVPSGIPHAHFDVYAWVPSAKPGRPEGGEAQAARLTFALVEERFG